MHRMNGMPWHAGVWFFVLALMITAGYCIQAGNYQSHTQSGRRVRVTLSNGIVRIEVCDTNILRVSFDARGLFTANVNNDARYPQDVLGMPDLNDTTKYPLVSYLLTDATPGDTGSIILTTAALRLTMAKKPFRLSYARADGTPLTAELAPMRATSNMGVADGHLSTSPAVTLTQNTDEHYYGWGLGYAHFRDCNWLDNDGHMYGNRRETACYMYSTRGYGLYFLFCEPVPVGSQWGGIADIAPGAGFDFTKGDTAKFWMSEGRSYDSTFVLTTRNVMLYTSYFFIAGDWKTAMTAYTHISGRPPRLGKKWYGIMRDLYEMKGVTIIKMKSWADMYRNARYNMDWIRMDNYFDWSYLGYYPDRMPADPGDCWDAGVVGTTGAIQYWRNKGFYFGGMTGGYGFNGCCSPGCTMKMVDDSITAATAMNNGYDWAWYDAMNYHSRTYAKAQWNNWVKAKQAAGKDETYVMISRGWQALSCQSWPANHMGDALNVTNSVVTKYTVFPSALAEHLVGYAWSHTDLGEGYDYNYIGISLRPMISFHMAGAAGSDVQNYQECDAVAGYPVDLQDVIRKWGNFHYKFIPYLFTYGMKAHETGIPPWRAMACQNGGEKDAAAQGLQYQCYVGEELIQSPYYDDNPVDKSDPGYRHSIYLPDVPGGYGAWYDYFRGKRYHSPTTIASYPVTGLNGASGRYGLTLPLFVKAGSIIPLGDTLQYIGEMPETLITVQVWPVGAEETMPTSGSFTLYEDEGKADWNSTYGSSTGYTTDPVKTELSYTYDGGVDTVVKTTVTIGAMSGDSRYLTDFAGNVFNRANRHYRVEIYAIPEPLQVNSGTITGLPEITREQYDANTPGWYYKSTGYDYAVLFVNAAGGDGSGTFNVEVSGPTTGVGPAERVRMMKKIAVKRIRQSIMVSVPLSGSHTVEVINIQGRVIARRDGASKAVYLISLDRQAPTCYLVRVTNSGKSIVKKVFLY